MWFKDFRFLSNQRSRRIHSGVCGSSSVPPVSISSSSFFIHRRKRVSVTTSIGSDFYSCDQRQSRLKTFGCSKTQKNALGFIPKYCLKVKLCSSKGLSNKD